MQILNNVGRICSKAIRVLVTCTLQILVFSALTGMTFTPQNNISREYQVKAVFLYNFCQFVEWPAKAFAHPNDPLVIGILGENPFENYLEETVKGEKANGHSLEVRHFQTVDQIRECHILFINLPEKDELKKALSALSSRNLLTVGDVSNFAKQGGIVRFFTENNKTRIRINLAAAKKAELTIHSKLLKLADVVNSDTN